MYFALKPVKFDKDYSRGEEIPEEVIAPNMVEKLIRCGVIQKVEEVDESETGEQSEEETKADEPPKENEVENEPPKENEVENEPPKENEVENEPPKEKAKAVKQSKKV